jgi:hypothetical protein
MYTYRSGMAVAPYRYRILTLNTLPGPGGGANVFNVASSAALTDANLTSILAHLKTFYTAVGSYVPGVFTIGSRILEFTPGAPAPTIRTVASASQTNASSSPLPGQLCSVVAWRTALAGKSYRGRTFLGPLNAAALTGTAISGAFIAAANAAAAALITNVRAVTDPAWGLVVHSDAIPTDTPVTSGLMDGRPDTLRSRS